LERFFLTKKKIIAITGAGVSTESGIPDYRGENGSYKLVGYNPMTYSQFLKFETQKRYWYRSMVGWPSISSKLPAGSHLALSQMLQENKVFHLITQNVDRLHHKAMPVTHHHLLSEITELHGNLYEVICLKCSEVFDRDSIQNELVELNRDSFDEEIKPIISNLENERPDGDTETLRSNFTNFVIPKCKCCGGPLKPRVVFFGENVEKEKVASCFANVENADGMLIIGSTLSTFSAWRFVQRARQMGIEIAVINLGETRADPICSVKIDGKAGLVLAQLLHNFE